LIIRVHFLAALMTGGLLSAAAVPPPFRLPLVFEQNQGQAPAPVKWMGQGSSYRVLFESEGATFLFPEESRNESPRGQKYDNHPSETHKIRNEIPVLRDRHERAQIENNRRSIE
jgi:hypothetical protein